MFSMNSMGSRSLGAGLGLGLLRQDQRPYGGEPDPEDGDLDQKQEKTKKEITADDLYLTKNNLGIQVDRHFSSEDKIK